MMKRIFVASLMLLVLCAACEKEEVEEEPAPAQPPPQRVPSPEEIYAEIKPILRPLQAVANQESNTLPDEAVADVVQKLSAAKSKHEVTDSGKSALSRLRRDVENIIKKGRELEYWRLVIKACDAYDVLDPKNLKTRRYRDIARRQLAKPKIEIRGFLEDEDTGDIYAFLKVKLRDTQETKLVQVREGEEFLEGEHTMRLVEIIGNNKGCRFEYKAIEGDIFEVMAE